MVPTHGLPGPAALESQAEGALSFRFEQVELILGRKLPAAARRHRAWWANDRVSHAQSRLWLEAGWRVSSISVTTETVTFTKIRGREEAYINFFSQFLHDIHRTGSPNGTNWHVIERIGSGEFSAMIMCSFTRGSRFRLELYIDLATKDEAIRRSANKQLFDSLAAQRDEIEGKLGQPLEWERLDNRTASRVAVYSGGSIMDTPDELGRLVKWATQMWPRFIQAVTPATQHTLREMANRVQSVA